MTYSEILKITLQGNTAILPHFKGYFKWNPGLNKFEFTNKNYKCNAEELDVLNRTDWFYII